MRYYKVLIDIHAENECDLKEQLEAIDGFNEIEWFVEYDVIDNEVEEDED